MSNFYFAWTEPDETTFGPEHEVEDEEIVQFTLEQNEGDFAELNISFRNPRVGPLAASRQVWAWFSYQSDSEVIPLGFFRLVAIPSNILGEIITYKFIARPSDFVEQKAALANTLRVLPFYDEIFIDAGHREDPDVVLEGYTKVWDIDRVTHEVTATDFLVGEEGVEVFNDTDVIHGTLNVTIDRPPIASVTINGEVPWTQTFGGQIILPDKSWSTMTQPNNWPKVGDELAGGYYVISSNASASLPPTAFTLNFNYTNRERTHRDGDVMSVTEALSSVRAPNGAMAFVLDQYAYHVTGDPATGTPASAGRSNSGLRVPYGWFRGGLTLGISGTAARKDAVSIVITSDVQPVMKDPADTSDTEIIDLGTSDVADECESESSPIIDPRRSEYVTTARGLLSLQYMIARARARLIIGARVVTISWECPLERALTLSCRQNVQIVWDGIPGDAAIGKIVSYSMRGDGQSGEFRGAVKIACAIGLGNAITTSDGIGDYIDDDYIDESYFTRTGQVIALPSGDIGYSPPIRISGGGGIGGGIVRDEIIGSLEDQETELLRVFRPPPIGDSLPADILESLHGMTTQQLANGLASTQMWREVEMIDMTNRSRDAAWEVETTHLVIPRQIDLTADVSA